MSAWAVLLGRPPESRVFSHSCGWLRDRFDGVVLVAEGPHPVDVPSQIPCIAEPHGSGAVGKLAAGLQLAPRDLDLFVYIDSDMLDGFAQATLSRMLEVLDPRDAAIVSGSPVTDALKRVRGTSIRESVERDGLCRITSPMVIRRRALEDASRLVRDAEAMDPASLLLAAGLRVRMVVPHRPEAATVIAEQMNAVAR